MTDAHARLSGEDLTFWWLDSPLQPTTMAMLMVLDRALDPARLRAAFERAIEAVPRLAQRVRDAPFGLTLPHWEDDPTFDLDYHVRPHALGGAADMDELLREIGPAYETPFDRSRPLWEARVFHGLGADGRAALFFKLHHAVADGVGANAIFAAMTDATREGDGPNPHRAGHSKGAWHEPRVGERVIDALRDRIELDLERAGSAARVVVDAVQHPDRIRRALTALRSLAEVARFDSHSPLRDAAGRARRLSGLELPFAEVRAVKHALGGTMIDVILTIMVRAAGAWHRAHGLGVEELMTLVPVNLRKPEEWTEKAHVGNVATGIMVALPIRLADPLATYRAVRERMEAKKADPASGAAPALAEAVSLLPRTLVSWLTEAAFFGNIDFIVTNVPGILVPRFLAGTEILAAYPFAPLAPRSPVSVALYGYREQLFVGLNSDEGVMTDLDRFKRLIRTAFEELQVASGTKRRTRGAARRKRAAPAQRRAAK
jgi:WS/DGAT/MGAT family acyltransferase